MKDITKKPVEGFFSIKCLDKNNNIIDFYEKKNTIMLKSKTTMANQIGGLNTDGIIGSFTLGTKGADSTGITSKAIDPAKTELFCQGTVPGPYWICDFTSTGAGNATINGRGNFNSSGGNIGNDTLSTIDITIIGSSVEYVITIDALDANGTGLTAYSEASLCTNLNKNFGTGKSGDIFAMRTFGNKIKDNSVKLVITWRIEF